MVISQQTCNLMFSSFSSYSYTIYLILGQSPPGSYSQLIPNDDPVPVLIHDSVNVMVPPSLPPHLLNVILNKDTLDDVSIYC